MVGSVNYPINGLFESYNICILGIIFGGHCTHHVLEHGNAFGVVIDYLHVQDDWPYLSGVSVAQCILVV